MLCYYRRLLFLLDSQLPEVLLYIPMHSKADILKGHWSSCTCVIPPLVSLPSTCHQYRKYAKKPYIFVLGTPSIKYVYDTFPAWFFLYIDIYSFCSHTFLFFTHVMFFHDLTFYRDEPANSVLEKSVRRYKWTLPQVQVDQSRVSFL